MRSADAIQPAGEEALQRLAQFRGLHRRARRQAADDQVAQVVHVHPQHAQAFQAALAGLRQFFVGLDLIAIHRRSVRQDAEAIDAGCREGICGERQGHITAFMGLPDLIPPAAYGLQRALPGRRLFR